MINEIEKKLEDFNNVSNFSDTNLVVKTIDKIERHQQNLCSYIFASFLVLNAFFLTSKVRH